ncbi:hypothetical protein DUNSADRAFT_9851, partial [Dunaliella salina]
PTSVPTQPLPPSIPLLPSSLPPQLTSPDPSPWALACDQDQATRAGWRAAAGLASAALKRPSVGGSTEVATHRSTISSTTTSPQSLAVAAPAASAHPRLLVHSRAGPSGQVNQAGAECGTHASLPPLPPLLAARLADHLRRKERRQLHPQARSRSPPSSMTSSVADSCESRPVRGPQQPVSSKAHAVRPARWRERVQLQAPQAACGGSSDESL